MAAARFAIEPAPAADSAPRLASNQAILEAWHEHAKLTLRPATERRYFLEIRSFLLAWGDHLATELTKRDLWHYLDQYSKGCTNLRPYDLRTKGPACKKGLDRANCGPLCPAYEAAKPQTVEGHLQTIVNLYDFLARREHVTHNHARDVKREWKKENKHLRRPNKRRLPTVQEIRMLLDVAPINRRALYATQAKLGLRLGEALSLRMGSVDHNARCIELPGLGGKRRGNRLLPIDTELRRILQRYERWRAGKAPDHDYYFINIQGAALAKRTGTTFNKRYYRHDAQRAGLQDSDTFTSHCMRHFFSDSLKHNGIDSYWLHILRGDVPPGTEDPYIHPRWSEIKRQYQQHGPRID